ncbi:MAG: DUF5106 domain-containing protein [Candidatus Amulumruptor caecigallinarius]|nr:DUF5106 domain-containing protein [Candidatus Amulumruptor caecigallinarius]MCM1396269.1 DUF5106 domain-containing protein [Candidatus Amulumruptor caecigallinarius]MCM1454263.1 DUF5106 domain-containing protein [bacterium]
MQQIRYIITHTAAWALIAIACLLMPVSVAAQTPAKTAFPYPTVPDTISTFNGRANYFVTHFWDFADLKRVFSNKAALKASFGDYLAMMPHTDGRVAQQSVTALLDKLKKQPDDLTFVALCAKEMLYGDSASFWSDELMIPFAEAVATNKKSPAAERVRMEQLARILNTNRRGESAPAPMMTMADGTQRAVYLPDDSVTFNVLFFNDPSCDACDLARIKLDADYLVSRLVNTGHVKITSIYPGEASDEEFGRMVKRLPAGWTAGALPEADLIYDLRTQPCFYVLTGQGFIVEKNLGVDDTMAILYRLRRLKDVNQAAGATQVETATEQ